MTQIKKINTKKVALEITSISGSSYRELARRIRILNIPSYNKIAVWLDSLFDKNTNYLNSSTIKWMRISSLTAKQVRDEAVDTAHAKGGLNFTLESEDGESHIPLNTPGLFYKEGPMNFIPVGLHRFYRAKNILKADLYPVIEIPESLIREVGMPAILDICRFDNSVTHQNKKSTLSQDAFSVYSTYKQKLQETDPSFNNKTLKEIEDKITEILGDKFNCKEKFPQHWKGIYEVAKTMSCASGPVEIRNHIFKETVSSGFKAFYNAKIDQVKDSLKKTHKSLEEQNKKDSNLLKESNNRFYSNIDDSIFEITLCEGGNQQEQNCLARLSRKRLNDKNIPIIGIICGVGSSKSAVLQSRISFLELFLPLAAVQGFNVVEQLLLANYKDGFWKYPQFMDGLKSEVFQYGENKFEISCDPENDTDEWEKVSVNYVIDFLRKQYNKNPNSCKFVDYDSDVEKIIMPKNCIVKQVENKTANKIAA